MDDIKDTIEKDMEQLYGEIAVAHWRCLIFEFLSTYQVLLHQKYTPEEAHNKIKNKLDNLLDRG